MPAYSQEASRQQWKAIFENACAWTKQNCREELEHLVSIVRKRRAEGEK